MGGKQLLAQHAAGGLANAKLGIQRYRPPNLPVRLSTHARRRMLKIPDIWPWHEVISTC